MKLNVHDTGDPSVGLFSCTYTIEVPFERDEVEQEELEWFRQQIIEVYREFACGRLIVEYDFEVNDLLIRDEEDEVQF